MESCLEKSKKLIETQVKEEAILNMHAERTQITKAYFSTNENIAQYLSLIDKYDYQNALTVLASGDQTYNLISKGIMQIDTFDINTLTKYYALGLKKAMILKYNFRQYLKAMETLENRNSSIEQISRIICDVLSFMETEYQNFWYELVCFNIEIQKFYKTNISLIYMLFTGVVGMSDKRDNNFYLQNQKAYSKLQSSLPNAHITYQCTNAIDLPSSFQGPYDTILLSNILDYFDKFWGRNWYYSQLKEYEKTLMPLLNDDGILFLKYIFNYCSRSYHKNILAPWSCLKADQFVDEEIITIDKNDNSLMSDGIIVLKKEI